jgi:serine/threonine protein kinase
MATVYLARQTDLDRHVALKELAVAHGSDPAFAERFLRESRMAGSLSHPNIVTVHDYFEHEGTPYISMEYIERGSLRPLVTKMTFAQIAGVLEGLLAGLQHAGSRGIVHRDMKPENVMVTGEGGVKISDFGIGRALNQAGKESRFLTATGTAIGTPAYMAPEQARGEDVDHRADVYSLAAILFRSITGHPAFTGKDVPTTLYDVVYRVPTQPSILAPLPADIDRVLAIGLAKDPKDRFQTALELAEWFGLAVESRLTPEQRQRADDLIVRQPWGTRPGVSSSGS